MYLCVKSSLGYWCYCLFASYAATVKNLRGVVLFDLEETGVWDTVKWLTGRFKYRNLGITPLIYEKYRDKLGKYMSGNPFKPLTYPLRELEEFTADFTKCAKLETELSELLVFSSIYISPAMVIGERYAHRISELSVESVRTCKDMSTSDWKLHMRVADYTVLDMYEFSVTSALRVLEECSISRLNNTISERISTIKKDTKRYWRILCEESKRVFLYYVDNLKLYAESCELRKLCGRSNVAAALAVIPVIVIPAGMK
jgi:hypothetical protein